MSLVNNTCKLYNKYIIYYKGAGSLNTTNINVIFYRYNSICEPIYINGLKSLGINVIEETTEIINKEVSGDETIARLQKLLTDNKIFFVISINYYPLISAVCNIFHIPYISIIVDSPVLELYSDTIKNTYNRIFIFDKALYNRHKNDNPDCIFYMPLCADTVHINNVLANNTRLYKKYSSDISFIGSLYTEKCPYNRVHNLPSYLKGYLDGIIESQLQLYGCNIVYDILTDDIVNEFMKYEKIYTFPEKSRKDYKAVLAYNYLGVKISELERIRLLKCISEEYKLDIYTGSDTSVIPKAINRGFASSLLEMPIIFNNSKINLQITARTIETGLSQRVWDVLSAGGFLIMNYQEELFEYFEPGTDLDYYGSKDELMDKICFYLHNNEIREKIAQNGQNKVLKYHTPIIRINEILKKL